MQPLPGVDRCPSSHPHGMLQILWMLHNVDIRRRELGRVKLEIKPSQYHCQGNGGLKGCKLVPHALTGTSSKRQVGKIGRVFIRVQDGPVPFRRIVSCPFRDVRVGVFAQPPFGDELVRLRPEPFIVMEIVQRYEHIHAANHGGLPPPALGQIVLGPAPANQQGRLGVQPQRLGHDQPQILHVLDILVGGHAVAQHPVDLGLDLGHLLRMLRQLEQRPGQHRGRGLVPRDQHGHEIVPQLLVVDVGAAHVHQKPQQRRILDVGVIALFELLDILHLARTLRAIDEVGQHRVQYVEVGVELPQTRHDLVSERQVPVRGGGHATVLGLDERGVHGLDHGGLVRDRSEFVIEHGESDDVEGDGAELFLHLDLATGLAGGRVVLGGRLLQISYQALVAVPEQAHHVIQPRLVERGHDGTTSHAPRLGIRGDQPLAHDGLQYLREDALVVQGVGIPQHVLRLHRVRYHQEALGTEAQLVRTAVLLLIALQSDEHGPVGNVGDLSLG
mmetsp:Transcript_267/g.629  ORF Transcript_267/g.629 Transcript_267/m.629 type:complete len:501 (-) Transcript_267:579-2081(-)